MSFLHCTDLHCSKFNNHHWFLWGPGGEWRATETWAVRFGAALDEAVAQGVGLVVMGGDNIDLQADGDTGPQADAEWVTDFLAHAYTGKVAVLDGNHEWMNTRYNFMLGRDDWEAATITALGARHVTLDGEIRDGSDRLLGYYFDYQGIRFVVQLYHGIQADKFVNEIFQSWFVGLQGGGLPIVFLRHLPDKGWGAYDAYTDKMPTECQAIFCGHDHRGAAPRQIPGTDVFEYTSTSGVRSGLPDDSVCTVNEGSHHLIEIKPSAVMGDNYMRANVQRTGFLRAANNEVVANNTYTQYSVM